MPPTHGHSLRQTQSIQWHFPLKYSKSIHLERPVEVIAQDSVLAMGEEAKPNILQVLSKDLSPFLIYSMIYRFPLNPLPGIPAPQE